MQDVVADKPHSNLQGYHREVMARQSVGLADHYQAVAKTAGLRRIIKEILAKLGLISCGCIIFSVGERGRRKSPLLDSNLYFLLLQLHSFLYLI